MERVVKAIDTIESSIEDYSIEHEDGYTQKNVNEIISRLKCVINRMYKAKPNLLPENLTSESLADFIDGYWTKSRDSTVIGLIGEKFDDYEAIEKFLRPLKNQSYNYCIPSKKGTGKLFMRWAEENGISCVDISNDYEYLWHRHDADLYGHMKDNSDFIIAFKTEGESLQFELQYTPTLTCYGK